MSSWLVGQSPGIHLKDQATAQPPSLCQSPNLGGKLGEQSWEQMCWYAAGGWQACSGPRPEAVPAWRRVTRRPEGLAWLRDSWEADDIP